MEGKPISSLQLCQNQGENKSKKSELTYWFNYKKSYNTLVTYFSSILSNLCNAWLRLPVAHHNSHVNAIFVYLPMQKHFVGKIHFIRVFSKSDKPRLRQLKIIPSIRCTVQSFSGWVNLSSCMGKYHQGREDTLCWEQIQCLTNLSITLKYLIP